MVDMDPDECDIYGCRLKKTEARTELTMTVGTESAPLQPCQIHLDFLMDTDPATYDIGYTYLRAVELRLHPAVPSE